MYWVIQDNIYNEAGFATLIDALKKLGIAHSIHKVIPFSRELYPDINPEGKVVVMGSYTLTHIAQAKGWEPGSFLNENFTFRKQIIHWNTHMLNNSAWLGLLKFATPYDEPFFIRPADDGKAFAGTVMDNPSFLKWKEQVLALKPEDGATMGGDTIVMICRGKKIHAEYRVWIVDKKVVTSSVYKVGRRVVSSPHVAPTIHKFAEKMADIYSPHRAYVMDVASTPEGLKIIEVNNLNSAGFYAGDVQRIVFAIEESF